MLIFRGVLVRMQKNMCFLCRSWCPERNLGVVEIPKLQICSLPSTPHQTTSELVDITQTPHLARKLQDKLLATFLAAMDGVQKKPGCNQDLLLWKMWKWHRCCERNHLHELKNTCHRHYILVYKEPLLIYHLVSILTLRYSYWLHKEKDMNITWLM